MLNEDEQLDLDLDELFKEPDEKPGDETDETVNSEQVDDTEKNRTNKRS